MPRTAVTGESSLALKNAQFDAQRERGHSHHSQAQAVGSVSSSASAITQGGEQKRSKPHSSKRVNKGSRNAVALSELELNQAGLVGSSRESSSVLSKNAVP